MSIQKRYSSEIESTISRRSLLTASIAATVANTCMADWSQSPSFDTVVIGGGISGLCTAYRLTSTGKQVLVIEELARAGGRVRTLREPFRKGVIAEAGATLFPMSHGRVMGYLQQFQIPLQILPFETNSTHFYIEKHWFTDALDASQMPFSLSANEKGDWAALFKRYLLDGMLVATKLQSVSGISDLSELQELDNQSFHEYLTSRGASAVASRLLEAGTASLAGNGPKTVSALSVLKDYSRRGPTFRIVGGNDKLVDAFECHLNHCCTVSRGSRVVQIEKAKGQLCVTFESANGSLGSAFCKRAVVAVPPPALTRIACFPSLSERCKEIAEVVKMTSALRAFVQYRSSNEQSSRGFLHVNAEVPYNWALNLKMDFGIGLLNFLSTSDNAAKLRAIPDKAKAIKILMQFSTSGPNLEGLAEGYEEFDWDAVPSIAGGFPWFKIGTFLDKVGSLCQPIEQVHFAGDWCSVWPGWVEGALESAHRVEQEINDSLN